MDLVAASLVVFTAMTLTLVQSANPTFFVPPVVTKPHPRFILTPEVLNGYNDFIRFANASQEPLATWYAYICTSS